MATKRATSDFFGPRFNLDWSDEMVKFIAHFAILRATVDVVPDARHLGRGVRINGIKVVSRSFSKG